MPENDDANPPAGAADDAAQPENVYSRLRGVVQRARAQNAQDNKLGLDDEVDADDAGMFGAEGGEPEQEDPFLIRMRQAENLPADVLHDLGVEDGERDGPLHGPQAFMADRIKMIEPGYDEFYDEPAEGLTYVAHIEPLYQKPEDICAGWMPLGNLGNYMAGIMGQPGMGSRIGQVVQAMGRRIFGNFPCFHAMQADAANDRRDGLGEIQVIVESGDDTENALKVEAWLAEHGQETVELAQLDFDAIFPGYRPQVTFTASENRSFVTVRETRERGAPRNATYFYTWPGGMMHYQAVPADLDQLRALAGVIRHQLPQARPRPPAP